MSNNALGLYLYELRSREKLSMRQLAELAGVTVYYISYLESGKRTNPSMQVMARLFKALKMSKEEIEHFLDLYAIQNGCVSCDIVDYIMMNDDVRTALRRSRDAPFSSPNWEDFIKKINKM